MIVYLSVYLITLIFIHRYSYYTKGVTKKNHRLLCTFAVLPLALLSGIRYEVGTDFHNYWGHASSIMYGRNWRYNFESGYNLLVKVVMYITSNEQWVFVVTSFIIMYVFWWGIRRKPYNICLSITVFVLGTFYFSSMNLVRMYIALAFVFVGYTYLVEDNIKAFLILTILASFFHTTALVSIAILPIWRHRDKSIFKLFVFFGVSLVLISLIAPYILSMVQRIYPTYTLERMNEEKQSIFRIAIELGVLALSAALYRFSLNRGNTDNDEFLFLIILSFTECLCLLCSSWFPYMNRVSTYFQVGQILLIPMMLNHISPKNKVLVKIGIYFYYVFYVFYSLVYAKSFGVLPYITCFQ